jgi:hypothetical protein
VSNQVSGHSGYSHYSYYNNYSESNYGCGCSYSCGYGCGCGCTDGNSCSYTYFDYNDTIQYTGWDNRGGQVNNPPFNARWQPFSGRINNGDDCGYGCGYGYGCGCGYSCDYSYHSASFSAPNFSVSMTETTYQDGTISESNNVWHKGRSSYYYYYGDGYLYSGSAPSSHIPGGSVPNVPSAAYGQTNFATRPLNYNSNPNFSKFAYVDPEAVLNEKCSKPPEPKVPDPVTPPVTSALIESDSMT